MRIYKLVEVTELSETTKVGCAMCNEVLPAPVEDVTEDQLFICEGCEKKIGS